VRHAPVATRIETGKRKPRPRTLERINRVLEAALRQHYLLSEAMGFAPALADLQTGAPVAGF
jgi:hypothetical protein